MADQAGVPATPTSGYKSTEFITTVLSMLSLLVPGIPDKYLPYVFGLAGVYGVARTTLKALHVRGSAAQIPDLPELPASLQGRAPVPGTTTTTITTVPRG